MKNIVYICDEIATWKFIYVTVSKKIDKLEKGRDFFMFEENPSQITAFSHR